MICRANWASTANKKFETPLDKKKTYYSGRKKPATDLATELGIRRNRLYKWKDTIDQKGSDAFPGKGKRTNTMTQASEISRLKRELAQTKEEVEILKKAAAFFAKELK